MAQELVQLQLHLAILVAVCAARDTTVLCPVKDRDLDPCQPEGNRRCCKEALLTSSHTLIELSVPWIMPPAKSLCSSAVTLALKAVGNPAAVEA